MASSEVERRLAALEERNDPGGLRIRRIIIAPASTGPEQLPVTGWQSGEIVTRRQPDETEAACWDRHCAALDKAHGSQAVTQSVQLIEGEAHERI